MLKVALTGSIAMGKSTVAQMMREAGVPVFDADAAVHTLYSTGGRAVPKVAALFPDVVVDGAIDRALLSRHVVGDGEAMKKLETIVHPLVKQEQQAFLRSAEIAGDKLVVFDIPLLFEGNRQAEFDAVLVVSAPADEQRRRALARDGMTEEKFEAILKKQVPDAKKRELADIVISTGNSLDETRAQVENEIQRLRNKFRKRNET